ncbi:ral guanine nucleotide dissociation stimulator-like [Camelus ferus]|uniref:Ral guanine nucleotide dissociation stimulator-like n=4 Tax=Camelus TaxID=9836 RepID=A0A8B8U1B8_CAMFR|nr:ral guanine nucleotide dissociation stimulator-like [Camelus ferus]
MENRTPHRKWDRTCSMESPAPISLQERQVLHDSSRAQDRLRVGVGPSRSRDEASRVWSLQQHRLEKLVAKLVTAILGGHPSYVNTFLGNYRTFATAQQVLDHLFRRYGCILPVTEEDGGPLHQLKQAMSSILGTWVLQYPDDFHQPPEFPGLKIVLAYVELSMPGSDLEQQAHLLLAQLEQLELPEAESDAPAPEPAGETPLDGEPAPALLPATAPEPEQRVVLSCEASTSSLLCCGWGPAQGLHQHSLRPRPWEVPGHGTIKMRTCTRRHSQDFDLMELAFS